MNTARLVPDVLRLIYHIIHHDFQTTVAWFWTCKDFAAMVTDEDKRWHHMAHVTQFGGLSEHGPVSRLAMFQGKLGVLWLEIPCTQLLPRQSWTREIWDWILYEADVDDKNESHATEEYVISQWKRYCEAPMYVPPRREWFVRHKQVYRFYPGVFDLWTDTWKTETRYMGQFIYQEVDWFPSSA
jgi:hypothetical protein